MIDVLLVAIILLIFYVVFYASVFYDFELTIKMLCSFVISIVLILVFWFVIRDLSKTQNYKIDKNVVYVDYVQYSENSSKLKFNKKLKVEVYTFDMPYSSFFDYENYRILFDSLTYIDVEASLFDSLDLKYGKKLYK